MTITTNGRGATLNGGRLTNYTNYIVATALDTTSPIAGPVISNRDGSITRVSFGHFVTDKVGSSATLQTALLGSFNGTDFFPVADSGNAAITTTAQSIAPSGSGVTVSEVEDTNAEGISAFPPFLRLQTTTGGTSSPGFNGTVQISVTRDPKLAASSL